jgi:hypothetical protein
MFVLLPHSSSVSHHHTDYCRMRQKQREFPIDTTNANANNDFHAKSEATLEYEVEQEKDAEPCATNEDIDDLRRKQVYALKEHRYYG